VQYNMSPETLLEECGDIRASGVDYYLDNDIDPELRERNLSVAVNGSMYTKEKRGVMPSIIIDLYDERREIKKSMLSADAELQLLQTELNELERA